MLQDKKLIIFDMDGCLVDSESLYTRIWDEVFKKNDIPIDVDEIVSWRGKGWGQIRALMNKVTDDDALTLRLREEREVLFFKNLKQGNLKLKPFAQEIINHLNDKGKLVAVGTSTYSDKATLILDYFDLHDKLDTKVFGDHVTHTKPNPDIYLKVLENLKVDKEDALIFEDSLSGIKAANNAGIDVIYVPDGETLDTSDLEVIKIIENFKEVM